MGCSLRGVQRLVQVRDQVLRLLDADGEADEAAGDAGRQPLLLGDHGVRHARRVLDEALGGAEGDREVDPLDFLADRRGRRVVLHQEGDHSSEAVLHLPLGQLVVRVGREAWVEHALHLGVPLEELGDELRVVRVRPHARHEGLHAAGHEVALPGAQGVAEQLRHVPEPAQLLLAPGRHAAGQHVGVASQVLRAGVDGDLDAGVRQRRLVVGGAEGAVDRHARLLVVGPRGADLQAQLAEGFQVRQAHRRVRRRLGVEHPGVWPHRRAPLLDRVAVHPGDLDAEGRQDA
mmetsp:Transcript_28448/g.75302  ORF Transcript_28448/g.75302 Transcript_28448/m.75302 type:complete len:289 (-) Transcript_28448:573-1439(-)